MANYISVSIHSQVSDVPTEKRYPSEIKINDLKEKLELITGANHKTMTVELSIDDKPAVALEDDERTLVHYVGQVPPKETHVKLIVKDDSSMDLLAGDVPHATISEENYVKRPNARDFIKQLREKKETTSS